MTKTPLPLVRVDGPLSAALLPDALRQLNRESLTSFLLQRRWFGAKGRSPNDVRIGDVVALDGGGVRAAIARLDVDLGGRNVYYQLPLAVKREGDGDAPRAVLARVEAQGERGLLFDAVEDPAFRAAIGAAFQRGATFGDGSRFVVEPVGADDVTRQLSGDTPSRVMGAEQSNTSIVFGDVAIMKLFRRLEPGINPDVEIGRFLTTRTRFRHTPPLLGVVRYEGVGGLHSVAGMLQGFLPGSSDAWQHALEASRDWFAAGDGTPHPFAADAERLGRVTRELHDALASSDDDSDFAPRSARAGDVQRWAANATRSIEDVTALLGERLESGDLEGEHEDEARALLRRGDEYLHYLDELVAVVGDDAGQLVRHHGDYHLGQVLRTRDGDFQIIDFEGEPARPLAERRARNSALRDVAGMVRSFAYAAATLAGEQADRASASERAQRLTRWERGAREAFLNGYFGDAPAAYLPRARDKVEALLALFEMEKVFYEMSYELNNRPDWAWIPISGASALLGASAGRR